MASHRKKSVRYQQIRDDINVVEETMELFNQIKGNWNTLFFKNENPIVLELACGRGEYSVGLGRLNPNKNYIGIDIKGERIAVGSKIANEENLKNIGFLRAKIQQLQDFFAESEISEIWIVFPDPRTKGADARRRLTHPRFLNIYNNILIDKGKLFLKTDSTSLFEYSRQTLPENNFNILDSTTNLYQSHLLEKHCGIKTHYENLFSSQGFDINYLEAVLNKKGLSK